MTGDGAGLWEPPLSGALAPMFEFAPPGVVYHAHGKFHFPVFLGFMLGLHSPRLA